MARDTCAPLKRRAILATLTASGLIATASSIAKPRRPTFIHGFGEGSPTGVITQFASAVVLSRAAVKPWIVTVPGENGFGAFQYFMSPLIEGDAFLIADTMTLIYNAMKNKQVDQISLMEPVAKLTNGISIALVASKASGIKQYGDVAAYGRGNALRIAHTGKYSAAGVALAWMTSTLPSFKNVICSGGDMVLQALSSDQADIGLAVTNTIPAAMKRTSDYEVVVTFGADRSSHFPDVPTFGELINDRKKSFTTSFSMFTYKSTPEAVVSGIREAFGQPFSPSLLASLGDLGQSIHINDASTVRETLARDFRVSLSVVNDLGV